LAIERASRHTCFWRARSPRQREVLEGASQPGFGAPQQKHANDFRLDRSKKLIGSSGTRRATRRELMRGELQWNRTDGTCPARQGPKRLAEVESRNLDAGLGGRAALSQRRVAIGLRQARARSYGGQGHVPRAREPHYTAIPRTTRARKELAVQPHLE